MVTYDSQRSKRLSKNANYGIHDLSAVELDPVNHLPRFNMPLELGLFLGCRRFGDAGQRRKVSLILDSQQYRYQTFISDIAGQDIHAHQGNPENAMREVRKWLAVASRHLRLPGGNDIVNRFRRFRNDFPDLCTAARLEPGEVTLRDLQRMIVSWLRLNR